MCSNRKSNTQAGFSLMELMVSMTVMTIITGAVFALIGSSLRFASATYNMTDAEQSLRTGHEMIHRDLTTAGDGLKGINTIQVPIGFVQNYLTTTPVADVGSPNYPNLGLVTSDDRVPANTPVPQANPAANVLALSDRLTMLTQDYTTFPPVPLLAGRITIASPNTTIQVTAAEIGRFQVGEIYAIATQNSAAFGVISSINAAANRLVMSNGDVYGLNHTGTGSINAVSAGGANATSILRLQIIHFYVNSNNLLIRRVFGVQGSGFVDSIIAEHVTGMQFRYLMDTTDPNGFVQQPAAQVTDPTAVREVETTIGVETVRAINAVTANNNGRQSISRTTSTTVRNLQFRRALSP